jgi:hypothetical protein
LLEEHGWGGGGARAAAGGGGGAAGDGGRGLGLGSIGHKLAAALLSSTARRPWLQERGDKERPELGHNKVHMYSLAGVGGCGVKEIGTCHMENEVYMFTSVSIWVRRCTMSRM